MAVTEEMVGEMARRQTMQQDLLIRFAEGQSGIDALRSVLRNQSVIFETTWDKVFAEAIVANREWGDPKDRSFLIRSAQLLKDRRFLACVESGVESIASSGKSPLNALQSSRQKKREEAYALIAQMCLAGDFQQLVDEWGLRIEIALKEAHGLYGIEICVFDTGNVLCMRAFLDAWSGTIAVGDSDVRLRFLTETEPSDVQQLLAKALTQSLDALTR